jgi:predicted TPR repeat methyltransferase
MLAVAEASAEYDELRVDEVTLAMEAEPAAYDLVVATDVLNYFGRLEEFFAAAARALRSNGRVAVTAERHDGDGYVLRSSGRYAHSADYLRAAAARAGLAPVNIRECSLRLELGSPVTGYTAVLERSSADPE